MAKVTIFGAGNMGKAIDGVLSAGGAQVSHITSGDAGATIEGEVVVLAVPYTAFDDIVAKYSDQLAGKVVVDITNPLDFTTFKLLPAADSSAAAELAPKLPNSKVIKAFNTNFAATLATGRVGEDTTTVLVAGDDADAKEQLGALVTGGGLGYVDAGDLSQARQLEAVGALQLGLAVGGKIPWTGGFAIVK
ncbi:diguanylate cyclase [Acidipropionibacterium acidipropionici]|jgi:predicted dinucleotide-binding enzyme|uniref:Diguanylate cyclase n=2 Tax=Acidipropionibacterium acidipropionici TaxID=1748 RepID=A0A142KIE1_9ACTN|nr:NADPH-dependent F420 reductase [Acidipropionibacterium acidipropionici]AFV88051.1 putative dinucleotide-binding enzyme [Acidipropionibacterium acidipropionici ATCC 4875]ALN14582.1 diguanylate cyclase [Acidipropionibacterium acidipropionici]AMS05879.1 diguanylate cyclase [Acidipropionibacterium acidipropionici]AOZ47343.1 diguanylate cyclase [Acidipropionibacterium acidipropionici]APZ09660.1 diguanylate cyclase [Acidipropionibacterium acidipropionici]